MSIPPRDLDPELEALLKEVEEDPSPDAALDAALADPLLAKVIERRIQHYEGILTDKAMQHARRTLAHVFTTSPKAIRTLARLREAVASGTATPDGMPIPQGKSKA